LLGRKTLKAIAMRELVSYELRRDVSQRVNMKTTYYRNSRLNCLREFGRRTNMRNKYSISLSQYAYVKIALKSCENITIRKAEEFHESQRADV